jgi:hypothetical protein
MKTVPAVKLSQEGCDITVAAAVEKAKELRVRRHRERRTLDAGRKTPL